MLRAYYSDRQPAAEIEISGTAEDLNAAREEILKFIRSHAQSLTFALDTAFDPSPYNSLLPMMVLSKGEGPTRVSVEGKQTLLVLGSPENLSRFASWFDYEVDAERGAHGHYEHYEGNEFIASDSVPLVIGIT